MSCGSHEERRGTTGPRELVWSGLSQRPLGLELAKAESTLGADSTQDLQAGKLAQTHLSSYTEKGQPVD